MIVLRRKVREKGARDSSGDRDRRGDQRGLAPRRAGTGPGRAAGGGFVTRLTGAGLNVTDLGDVVTATFTPDAVTATARNLAQVVAAALTQSP